MPAQLESVRHKLPPGTVRSVSDIAASHQAFYYPQLDGLRTLAFLLVFASHAGGFYPDKCWTGLREVAITYNNFVQFGWCGVDLFFVLSAFLITSLLLREESLFQNINVPNFLLRRMLRIWPLYFLIFFVGMCTFPFVDPAVVNGGIRFGTKIFSSYLCANLFWGLTFTLNIGMAYGLAFPPAGLTPLWSVSLEEQFYLFWSIFLSFAKSAFSRVGLVLVLLMVTITCRSYFMGTVPHSHVPYYVCTISRLDPLIFGALIAFANQYIRSFALVSGRLGLAWFVASLVVFKWATTVNMRIFDEHNPFALTFFAFGWSLFLMSALYFEPVVKVFSNRFIAGFGRLTYGMYLVHALVLNTIFNQFVKPYGIAFPSNESALLGIFAGLPLTAGIAWLLWYGYERRFYILKDKFARVKSGFMYAGTYVLPREVCQGGAE